jgi:hypothetical protein
LSKEETPSCPCGKRLCLPSSKTKASKKVGR